MNIRSQVSTIAAEAGLAPAQTHQNSKVIEIAASQAVLTSLRGQVHFEKRTLWMFQPTTAWSRLQEFHQGSFAQISSFTLAATLQLTPKQAADAFQISLVCAIGQFAVIPTVGRQQLFTSLLQHVSHTRSFDGLESLFLTGLNSVDLAGNNQLFAQGLALWKQIGPPARLGGGLSSAPFLNTGTGTLPSSAQMLSLALDHKVQT